MLYRSAPAAATTSSSNHKQHWRSLENIYQGNSNLLTHILRDKPCKSMSQECEGGYGYGRQPRRHQSLPPWDCRQAEVPTTGWPIGCSAKRLFLSYVLPSTYMVPLGDWSLQKKFQHYRPINGFGMAIWSFDLFYNVKTAEIGAKIFKINKMAKNHFSR